MSAFLEALGRVPPLLAAHVLLSACALLLGIAISVPLGIWSARNADALALSARQCIGVARGNLGG